MIEQEHLDKLAQSKLRAAIDREDDTYLENI